jgi:hypothetical protein
VPRAISKTSGLKKSLNAALAACLFLLIVGAKWATFDRFGSPMPDWDQWDAEAVHLFIPWFENDTFITHLFTPHNEHRVVLTKLQNLALVLINGQWDSRLEAITNAMLHAALAVAFWHFARHWLKRPKEVVGPSSVPPLDAGETLPGLEAFLFIVAFALFGLPLAWQNILGGFHSQQYWLLGLSFAAIVTLPFAPTWSARWWIGALSAVLALGSMGSGFLAAAVVLALLLWRVACGETKLRAVWPSLVLCGGLIAAGLLTRVEVYYHQQLKAKTAHDFIFSILRSAEWPLRDHDWAGIILWLPWLLVAWQVVQGRTGFRPLWARSQTRPTLEPTVSVIDQALNAYAAQAIVALGGWVLVQLIATAYARGAGADYPASRYMDTLSFGAMLNAVALGWLLAAITPQRRIRFAYYALALAWITTLGIGLRDILERNLRYELPDAKKYYAKAEGNMRRYLATNDPKQLASPDIPFPSAEGLIERLAHPSLRALMPLPIRAPIAVLPAAGETAFVKNDARIADPNHPPRDGLSPATPPLDAAPTFGSFTRDGAAATGNWKSAPIAASRFGWLKFETAGQPDAPNAAVSLALHDAETDAFLKEVCPTKLPGDSWRAAYVRTPMQPFVIVAKDRSPNRWLAFSAPVEMGTASYWAWQAAKNGMLLVYFAAAATAGLTFAAWLVSKRRSS